MARTWLSAILLTCSVSLVACNGSSDDSGAATPAADNGGSTPAASAPKSKASAFVGDWSVDKEAMTGIFTEAMLAQAGDVSEEQKQMMMDMVPSMIEGMEMNLTIASDGTFTGVSSGMGETETITGTWVVADGTITMTENDSEEPPATGTVSGDRLTFEFPSEEEDGPGEIVMKRAG